MIICHGYLLIAIRPSRVDGMKTYRFLELCIIPIRPSLLAMKSPLTLEVLGPFWTLRSFYINSRKYEGRVRSYIISTISTLFPLHNQKMSGRMNPEARDESIGL